MTMTDSGTRVELKRKDRDRVDDMIPGLDMDGAVEVDLPFEWSTAFAEKVRKESPSSIVNFLSCPLKWYIERHAPIPGDDEVSVFAFAGTVAHRMLEVFYSEPAKFRTHKMLGEIRELVWDAIETANLDDGIVDREIVETYAKLMEQAPTNSRYPTTEARQQRKLHELVDKAMDNLYDIEDPKGVELISNEGWLRMMSNGIRVNGRFDRAQQGPGGTELDDWKTGKAPDLDPDETPDILNPVFIPAGMYAAMYLQMNADELLPPKVDHVKLIYLAHRKVFTIPINDRRVAMIERLVDKVTSLMNRMAKEGTLIATPASRKDRGQCGYCPLVDICPAWTDNKDLEAAREKWGV